MKTAMGKTILTRAGLIFSTICLLFILAWITWGCGSDSTDTVTVTVTEAAPTVTQTVTVTAPNTATTSEVASSADETSASNNVTDSMGAAPASDSNETETQEEDREGIPVYVETRTAADGSQQQVLIDANTGEVLSGNYVLVPDNGSGNQ